MLIIRRRYFDENQYQLNNNLNMFYSVDDSDVDYIEQLVTQLSDAESEDATFRQSLHKPLDAVLSPLPQSPFARVEVRDFCSDTDGSSSVSFQTFLLNSARK